MDFKTYWLSMATEQRQDFAARCGVHPQSLENIAHGQRGISPRLAVAIDRESAGQVDCQRLAPDMDWAYLRSKFARQLAAAAAGL